MNVSLHSETLQTYLTDWLENYCKPRHALNTYLSYQNVIYKYISPTIGNIPLCDIKPQDLQELYATLAKKKLSNSSILLTHRTLHAAFNIGLKTMHLQYNPANHVFPPRKSEFYPTVLRPEELQSLLQYVRCDETMYTIVLTLSSLGLRRGELLSLTWNDLNIDQKTLSINKNITFTDGGFSIGKTKTKSSNRTIQLTESLLSTLLSHKKLQVKWSKTANKGFNPMGLIVCSKKGLPINPTTLQKNYKKALKACNLPNVRLHDLRHTFATIMLQNDVAPKIVSSYLGHANISITLDIYSHVLTSMQEPIVRTMENVLQGQVAIANG